MIHPVIAGRGPRLFEGIAESRVLERVSVKMLSTGQLATHYRSRAT